jgi:hypothetical protein
VQQEVQWLEAVASHERLQAQQGDLLADSSACLANRRHRLLCRTPCTLQQQAAALMRSEPMVPWFHHHHHSQQQQQAAGMVVLTRLGTGCRLRHVPPADPTAAWLLPPSPPLLRVHKPPAWLT